MFHIRSVILRRKVVEIPQKKRVEIEIKDH